MQLQPTNVSKPVHDAAGLLRIYHQNTRGLRTKLDDVYLAVMENDYDVYVFTETWLDDRFNSVQLFGETFTVFRTDRNSNNSIHKRGGGVLIAVTTSYASSQITDNVPVTLETVWVKIAVAGNSVIVGAVYIPPEKRLDCCVMQAELNILESVTAALNLQDAVIFLGDFNQPGLVWKTSSIGYAFVDPLHSSLSPASRILLDGTAFLGLRQINSVCNHQSRCLDLVFISESCLPLCTVTEAPETIVARDVFHPALCIEFMAYRPVVFDDMTNWSQFDYRKTDIELLRSLLSQIDWSPLNNFSVVDDAVAFYNRVLNDSLVIAVPPPQPAKKPPWTNAKLQRLKRLRAKSLRAYTKRRCVMLKHKFVVASNEYRAYNKSLYNRYVRRTQQNLRKNPKHFWKFVNTKRKENGLPSSMFYNGQYAETPSDKCNLFARYFSSVFSSNTLGAAQIQNALSDVPSDTLSMDIFRISEQSVSSAIGSVKSSFSPGPGIIPTAILKKCSDYLVAPLTCLFNLSLQQQCFPVSWKYSCMFPIYKKGDKCNMANYRGITSLCAESKVFETIVKDTLFAACRNYISTVQHGFFPGRSVETNLVNFVTFCTKNMSTKAQVDTVYTDLKAAFDTVNYTILLKKLDKLGCTLRFCKWLETYLVDRQLFVQLGSCRSTAFTNCSGVPQGSNLGPLLFCIYVNDAALLLSRGGRLFFADDLKIFLVVRRVEDCRELQRLLDLFSSWCARNHLLLSVEKCCVISYCRTRSALHFDYEINGAKISRVEQVKDLGVILDEKLTFKSHMSATIDKASRNLGFIFKIASEFNDPLCFKALYCSIVRSSLEFASVVWSPHELVWCTRLEGVQRKFVRYALRQLPWREHQHLTPYEDRCRLLGIDTLGRRRQASQVMFVCKLLTGEYDAPDLLSQIGLYAPTRVLRPRMMLQEESHPTVYAANSPIASMIRQFNRYTELFNFDEPLYIYRRRILASVTQI